MMNLKAQIDPQRLPKHLAIIMDGNGRWANRQDKKRTLGHEQGALAVRKTVEAAAEIGIQVLTLYAFSTENWNRPQEEVDALMNLLVKSIRNETPTLQKNNIRLQSIGQREALDADTRHILEEAILQTANNSGMTLCLALSYSGRWEILNTIRQLPSPLPQLSDNELQKLFEQKLLTAQYPEVDLLIRTSGEYRISNFLLWQIAYAELYFTPTLWPDFSDQDLYIAILDYQSRERRFGKTSDQILNHPFEN